MSAKPLGVGFACLSIAMLCGPVVAGAQSTDRLPTFRIGTIGEINVRARVDATLRTPTPDEGFDSYDFDWRTLRAGLDGTVFKRVEFEVSHEFGDPTEPEHDEYVNVRVMRAIQLQGGLFKIPFGRDALTSRARIDFVYRSLAGDQLAPGRDLGVMAHGRLAGRLVSYEAGVFSGDGDNARTSQTRGASEALAGRMVVAPFASKRDSALAALEIGIAAVRSQLDDQLGLRGRTVFHEGVFFDRVFVNGARLRRGLEIGWTLGPFSASSEYIDVTDQRRGMGLHGEALPNVHAAGWYAAGTWLVTGERKRNRVQPGRNLFDGGSGAIEIAARIERLAFDSIDYPGTTFGFPNIGHLSANSERVTTIGTTWYLNSLLKVRANLVLEVIDDSARSPAPTGNGRFPSGVFQFQLAL